MPPLDHATLQAVLDKQGMPNTTENLNRIAQFAAVAPDMLDKYLGRGTDQARVDAGGGTDDAIDRSIASTADPRLAQLAGPNPYKATLDPNTGLTNIGPGLVNTPEPRAGGGAPSNRGRAGVAPNTEPPPGTIPQQGAPPTGGDSNWWNWLLPTLLAVGYRGRGNTGAPGEPWVGEKPPGTPPEADYVGRMPRPGPTEPPQGALPQRPGQPTLPAPQQQLPSESPDVSATARPAPPQQAPAPPAALPAPNRTNRPGPTPEQLESVRQDNINQQLEAERQQRLLTDEIRRQQAQSSTRELLNSARGSQRRVRVPIK